MGNLTDPKIPTKVLILFNFYAFVYVGSYLDFATLNS